MGGKSKKRRIEPDVESPEAEAEYDSEVKQRVESIIKSPAFFENMTAIVERQMKAKKSSDQLEVLEDVCKVLFKSSFRKKIPKNPCPINDLATTAFDPEENAIRLQMAAAFRIMESSGWSSNVFRPATAKYRDYFIVNPSNVHYRNITASNLLIIDKDGKVVDCGTSNHAAAPSRKDFVLNAAIHSTYPDVKCVIQLKHPPCVAISATNTSILPLSSEAIALGAVLCIDLRGKDEASQKSEILKSFKQNTKVIISKNRGFFILGKTIQEAVFLTNKAIAASEIQACLMPLELDKLTYAVDEESDEEENFGSFWDLHLQHVMKTAEKESQNYYGFSAGKGVKMLQDDVNDVLSTNIKIQGYVIVADTNAYIHDYCLIKQMLLPNTLYKGENLVLYLPWIVLKELDTLKEKCQVTNSARRAISFLHRNMLVKNPRLQYQTLDEYEITCSCFELNNDDKILQSCRTLKVNNKVLLLTDDLNFQCQAIMADVHFSSTTDFICKLQVPLQQASNRKAVNSKMGKDNSASRKSSTLSYPSMSDEDKQAIERLKATGFEESLLIEAYFKSGKDETRTVDYILKVISGKD